MILLLFQFTYFNFYENCCAMMPRKTEPSSSEDLCIQTLARSVPFWYMTR